jgi:hypothetical protein
VKSGDNFGNSCNMRLKVQVSFRSFSTKEIQAEPVPLSLLWYSEGVQPYCALKQLAKWAGDPNPVIPPRINWILPSHLSISRHFRRPGEKSPAVTRLETVNQSYGWVHSFKPTNPLVGLAKPGTRQEFGHHQLIGGITL